jgi:hypothetical protein
LFAYELIAFFLVDKFLSIASLIGSILGYFGGKNMSDHDYVRLAAVGGGGSHVSIEMGDRGTNEDGHSNL